MYTHMNFYNADTFIVLFSDLFHIMITHISLNFGPRVRTERVTIEYAIYSLCYNRSEVQECNHIHPATIGVRLSAVFLDTDRMPSSTLKDVGTTQ